MDNIRLIAETRYKDLMNTWPDHNDYHRRTILGVTLGDEQCLRCQLENVASREYAKVKEEPKDEKID